MFSVGLKKLPESLEKIKAISSDTEKLERPLDIFIRDEN